MNFAGRRIGVLGAGREGRATLAYLLSHGADADKVTVCDRVKVAGLPSAVRTKFGGNYLGGLEEFEIVFRSPGIPWLSPEIQAAIRAGVKVSSHTKLFFAEVPAPIVGVSGTKGKGTTAGLIHGMLKAGGRRSFLGGNIGTPPLEFLDKLTKKTPVVLELSSFQLQDLTRSPQVAVLTNLTEDHLDYHRDVKEYHEAKASLLKFQSTSDLAVVNADDPGSQKLARRYSQGRVRQFSYRHAVDDGAFVTDGQVVLRRGADKVSVLSTADIPVPGPHNLNNVLAACSTAQEFGVSAGQMAQAVREYRGLPYHLEYLGEKSGARYFNDSYAANPTATIPAIESFTDPVVLIAGGYERNLDFRPLAKAIAGSSVRVVLLLGEAGQRLGETLQELNVKELPTVEVGHKNDLPAAIQDAAQPGDVVLFSPGAPSFDWFRDFEERGQFFTEQVFRQARR